MLTPELEGFSLIGSLDVCAQLTSPSDLKAAAPSFEGALLWSKPFADDCKSESLVVAEGIRLRAS